MSSPQRQPLQASLDALTGEFADAAQVAEATVVLVLEIGACLRPVVGKLGVEALYRRSVFLASQGHPWMTAALQASQPAMDLASLRVALSAQSRPEATAGGEALLTALDHVLVSLVGPSLAERMWRPVAGLPSAHPGGSSGLASQGSSLQKDASPWPTK
jgi:type IV secretory pathway VirB2 component (pilin)